MTTMPKPFSPFETRGAKDADPATASLAEDIGRARGTDYFLMMATIWSQEAIARAEEHVVDLRGTVVLRDCGHWIPQEHPDAVNKELLTFLTGL